jgi:hypothetical protein
VDLFTKTLRHFLAGLEKEKPELLELLSDELVAWLGKEPKGWFGDKCERRYRAKFQKLAEWVHEVVVVFAANKEIVADERYQLVVRLFNDHCEVVSTPVPPSDDGGENDGGSENNETEIKIRKKPGGSSLQSPFDPDAGCGHKGVGYSLELAETCRNEGPEIITDYDVLSGRSDIGRTDEILSRLNDRGLTPTDLYADGGYYTGDSYINARDNGTEIHAPAHTGRLRKDALRRDLFRFDEDTGYVLACPAGNTPVRHAIRTGNTYRKNRPRNIGLHAYFDGATCRGCDLRERCIARSPTSGNKGDFRVEIRPALVARDRRIAEQREDVFWERYSIRSGVEATFSELKRAHGVGKLSVRGYPAVRLKVSFKLMACNVKRWLGGVHTLADDLNGARGAVFALWYRLFAATQTHLDKLARLIRNYPSEVDTIFTIGSSLKTS